MYISAEEALVAAKNKILSDTKIEMDKQRYAKTSLAKFFNVNRPSESFTVHGRTMPRDVKVRKNLLHFRNGV